MSEQTYVGTGYDVEIIFNVYDVETQKKCNIEWSADIYSFFKARETRGFATDF